MPSARFRVRHSSAPATSAPAQSGERKKWNPKAKAEASSSTVSPQPSAPAPITEHVVLDEVGVNGLEEGHAATSAPDAAQGDVPVTTQPAVPQPAAVQTGEVNAETGRKKWQPKK